jgi:hypothetical protein
MFSDKTPDLKTMTGYILNYGGISYVVKIIGSDTNHALIKSMVDAIK